MIDYLTFVDELKQIRSQLDDRAYVHSDISKLIKKYEDRVKANEEDNNA